GKAVRRRSGCLAFDVLVCPPGRDLDRCDAAHPRAGRLAPNVDGSPWRDKWIGAPEGICPLRRRNSEAIRRLHIGAAARDRGRTRSDGFRFLFGGGFRPRHRNRAAECQSQSQPVSCSHLTLPGVVWTRRTLGTAPRHLNRIELELTRRSSRQARSFQILGAKIAVPRAKTGHPSQNQRRKLKWA